MTQDMTIERLNAIVAAYGARAYRWPQDEREAALALLERSPDARALREQAALLDEALDLVAVDKPGMELRQAVLAQAPKPRRRAPFRVGAPTGMALAASLLLGIVAGGWVGREYQADMATSTASSADQGMDFLQIAKMSSDLEDY